ncbi:MAG: hypothetical protein ACRDCC_11630 [Culicoidibacterales bacterium]
MEIIRSSIFSAATVAALVTAIFAYRNSKNSNELMHITAERREWRRDLRGIAEKVNASMTASELYANLIPLRVRINPLYTSTDSTKIDEENPAIIDCWLWERINLLEKSDDVNESELLEIKKEIIILLEALLKYDWERSKKEVKGDSFKKIATILTGIGIMSLLVGMIIGLPKLITLGEMENPLKIIINQVFAGEFIVVTAILALLLLMIAILHDWSREEAEQELVSKNNDMKTLIKIVRVISLIGMVAMIGMIVMMIATMMGITVATMIGSMIATMNGSMIATMNGSMIATMMGITVATMIGSMVAIIIGVLFAIRAKNVTIQLLASVLIIMATTASVYLISFKPEVVGIQSLLLLTISFACLVLTLYYDKKSEQLRVEQLKVIHKTRKFVNDKAIGKNKR